MTDITDKISDAANVKKPEYIAKKDINYKEDTRSDTY